MEMMGIAGSTALVTGAAGGIGRAITAALSEAGARVAAADIEFPAPEPATGAAGAWRLDVTRPDEVETVVAAIEDDLGPIRLLVNAAGVIGRLAPMLEQQPEDLEHLFAVHVRGTFLCSRAVARRMVRRRDGCVVTIGSNSATTLRMDQALYGAAKTAAAYVTNCLGFELAAHGVRCVVVSPGTTDTPMAHARRSARRIDDLINGDAREFRPGIPLGRLAQPSDIAGAVLFLASDHARHITCANLVIDGGASLRPM